MTNLAKVTRTPKALDKANWNIEYDTRKSFVDTDNQLFTMYGQEMYPKFQAGQVMICKHFDHWNLIPFGNPFLIVTESIRLVRYVKKANSPDYVLLVSENKQYDDIEIHRSQIQKLYLITGTIKYCEL